MKTNRQEVVIPGNPALTLTVYGVNKAKDLGQEMAQGFFVQRDGKPVSRAEQSTSEREAVLAYLLQHYPQHAELVLGKVGVAALEEFRSAIDDLAKTTEGFKAGQIKSVPHSDQRSAAIIKALVNMAKALGTELDDPLCIDSRGEIKVFGKAIGHYRGGDRVKYGVDFATWLNRYNPRTGISPGATMDAASCWCHMNHFEVERMVLAYAATLKAPA